jgi:hypothetical protein
VRRDLIQKYKKMIKLVKYVVDFNQVGGNVTKIEEILKIFNQ